MRIHDGKCWSSVGKVVRRHANPRSFIINTGTQLLRRNLLKVPNNATRVKQPYFDDDSSYPNVGNEVNPEHRNNNVGDEVNPEHRNNNVRPVVERDDAVMITRYGREVHRPRYLNDYATYQYYKNKPH